MLAAVYLYVGLFSCSVDLLTCSRLVVLLFSSALRSHAWGGFAKGSITAKGTTKEQEILSPGLDEPSPSTPGAASVHEARAILNSLQPLYTPSQQLSRNSGTLSTIWHYLKKVFVLLFLDRPQSTSPTVTRIEPPLSHAMELLSSASTQGNPDATYILADTAFYGKYGHPRNYTMAIDHYYALASREGNASAQQMLGFMYATGIGNVVEPDQAKALLYNTFAADGGDTRAQMATAYRHHAGIATPMNCEKSVHYYRNVAEKAIKYGSSGPPGGRRLVKESYRVADEVGGIYGDGASFSSAGPNARRSLAPDSDQNLDNFLEYLDIMSRKGDMKATFKLGQYYYDGSRILRPNFGAAKSIFMSIAQRYWSKDGKIKPDADRDLEILASKAASYLGRMFLRGEGMDQNFAKAKVWFRRGIENGDAACQYSMGLMYLHGLGMETDAIKASEYFGAAADQDHSWAQVRLGVLMMDQGDLATATRYFEVASRHNNVEALYYLAELANQGLGRDRSCTTAAHFYKIVAEKTEALHSSFGEANAMYNAGDIDGALTLYLQAAEQGYEAAQANVAYILDKTVRSYRTPLHALFPSLSRYASAKRSDAALALTYWTRSARQANVDSLVKMGDYYLSGLGTATNSSDLPTTTSHDILPSSAFTSAPDKAASCYSAASETQMSAQALWNLGWMHENGLGGMSQDFHLAKRYYDQSLETNAEAYLPVTLALFKLRIRSWWNGVSGGGAKGIGDAEGEKPRRTLSDWLTEFIIAELGALEEEQAQVAVGGEDGGADEWDAGTAMDDENLYEDIITDQFFEALMFAVLAAGLAVLVWYRQLVRQRQQGGDGGNEQRQGQDQAQPQAQAQGQAREQQQGQERGMFPRPGDPEFANWVAGGVGH